MDTIIESYIKELQDQGILENNITSFKSFELLNNYLFITKGSNDLEIADFLLVENFQGLDSIAININGEILPSNNTYLIEQAMTPESNIEIIFIQSKLSCNFENQVIEGITSSIIKLINDKNSFISFITEKITMIKKLSCSILYITNGVIEPSNFETTIQLCKQKLSETNIFDSDIVVNLIGNQDIKDEYRRITQSSENNIDLIKPITIDQLPEEVEEAYLALITFENLKKIISNEQSNPFFDNVRSFLGQNNKVNSSIEETVNKEEDLFVLLNNGITLISDKPNSVRKKDTFTVKNYQIVNGCQTCHVLKLVTKDISNLLLPIKLVYTENEDIKSKIILATNNQSSISQEQLEAITNFQKNLVEFFQIQNPKIYYERRVNEFKGNKYPSSHIITIREEIKIMIAMFFKKPNRVSGYFSITYDEYKNKLFKNSHSFELYYLAAFTNFKFQILKKEIEIFKTYNAARYHIFFIVKLLFENKSELQMNINQSPNKKKIQEYFTSFKEYINEANFKESIDILNKVITEKDLKDNKKKKSIYNHKIPSQLEEIIKNVSNP